MSSPKRAAGIFWTGHPNNPTGRAWDRDHLLGLIDRSPALLSVVDEAYLPFLPDEAERTLIRAVTTRDNVIVLRSMTKIFAFPGLRIGYAVAAPEMINRLRRCQQPWTIATAAEVAALVALDDDEYLDRTIELIATESARITERLWDLPGLRPVWPGPERPAIRPTDRPTSCSSAWSIPPGPRSRSRKPWRAAASSSANAPTTAASKTARS